MDQGGQVEILRAGPPRWMGWLFALQALLAGLLLAAAVWVPRAETSVFAATATATGARVRRYGLRWRAIAWAEVAEVREAGR